MTKNDFIYNICLVYVQHMKVCIEYGSGWNTYMFSHLFNRKEEDLISLGKSKAIQENSQTRLEHLVPKAILLIETRRLIEEKKLSDEKIARLLQKHWKVARITKKEQEQLDLKCNLNLKQTMPNGWSYEKDDTLARLKLAKIELIQDIDT